MNDEVEARYHDFVRLQLESGRLLRTADERALIREGITTFGLSGARARGILAVALHETGNPSERELSRHILHVLRELAGKRGAIDKKRFKQGVTVLKGLTAGGISPDEARIWLKRVVEDSDLKVGGSGLLWRTRWFRKIPSAA
jgi:hypothetical protein